LLQEFYDLLQFFLGLITTGHIIKTDRGMVAGEHTRPALAEGHRLVVCSLRLAKDKVEKAHDEQRGQENTDNVEQTAPLTRPFVVVAGLCIGRAGPGNAVCGQEFFERAEIIDAGAIGWTAIILVYTVSSASVTGYDYFSHLIRLELRG